MPERFDVHCNHCGQVIFPADRMKSMAEWSKESRADELLVVDVGTAVIVNVDLVCKNCGSSVYFRLNEQRLKLLLGKVGK
jgi:hypothetical protein